MPSPATSDVRGSFVSRTCVRPLSPCLMRPLTLLHFHPRRLGARRLALRGLLLAVLPLAACIDDVVAPVDRPATGAPPRAPALAFAPPTSGLLASSALPIPPNNTYGLGATPWTPIDYTVEEAGWVELRTSGSVFWEVNPAAYNTACGWFCTGPDASPFFGSGEAGGAGSSHGQLRTELLASASRPSGNGGAAYATTADGQVYSLLRVEPGTRLWASRTGIRGVASCVGACGDKDPGPTGWYLLESSMKVEVRKVVPIQVQPDTTAFVAGDTLTWTTVLYPGITNLIWRFEYAQGSEEVLCSETCRYAPRGPGRMMVSAQWTQGWPAVPVHGYSAPVTDEPPTIALTCTDSLGVRNRIIRGQTLTCTASKDPATAPGELKIGGWSFEGKPRTDGVVTSTEWRGVMVTGGTISVHGTIGASPEETASAPISVEARTNWAGVIVYPATLPDTVFDPARFPNPPVRDSSGYDVYLPGGLGLYEFDLKWRGHLAPVTSGPNKDWWYLRTPPQWMTPVVYLSPYLEAGNPFYEAQTGKRTGDNAPPRGYTGWCTKSDMDILKQEVLDHEGAISGPRLSHHEFNVAYTSRRDPGPVVEGVVFYLADQTASLQKVAELQIAQAYEAPMLAANTAAVHASSNTYTVPCKVHYP